MVLTDEEYQIYIKTHVDLLYFIGLQKKIIPFNTDHKSFLDLDMKIKFECREALLADMALIEEYIASNFDHLTNEQVKILEGFKRKVQSDFVILKCLTNYAVFMDIKTNNFYAVRALGDPFDTFFKQFPVHVTATLIPFRDKIIYDGFIQSSGIHYGRNITRSMNENYKSAKENKTIWTKL